MYRGSNFLLLFNWLLYMKMFVIVFLFKITLTCSWHGIRRQLERFKELEDQNRHF